MYVGKFREAERKLQDEGRPVVGSFADVLETKASRIFACFNRLLGVVRRMRLMFVKWCGWRLGLMVGKRMGILGVLR